MAGNLCIDVDFPFLGRGTIELNQCIQVFCDPCINIVHALPVSVELCEVGLHCSMLVYDDIVMGFFSHMDLIE
jgi:hypothetical protein